jgi:hypothetical protein
VIVWIANHMPDPSVGKSSRSTTHITTPPPMPMQSVITEMSSAARRAERVTRRSSVRAG